MVRRRLAVVAAAVGATSFLLLPFAVPAGAGEEPLPIYTSVGTGQGVVATAAVRPSILESAGQGGALFAETSLSSQGGGFTQSLAAPVYPGSFVIGAVTGATGCGGIKGWVEARYPATDNCASSQRDSFARGGPPQLTAAAGDMSVTAGLGEGTSDLASAAVIVRPSAADPPLLDIGSMTVRIDGRRIDAALDQLVEVTAEEISLLDDAVRIGSMVSRAFTRTDGSDAVAEASLTLADVEVTVNGNRHRATITSEGIHVNDPELSREENIGLSETVEDTLLRAGISISAASPVEITDGGSAEAVVGGLTITFSATLPSVSVPDEAAPTFATIIEAIPTKCVREITHEDRPDQLAPITDNLPEVPLCFGAGVIPLGGSEPVLGLTVGGASSFSIGARPDPFLGPPSDPADPPPFNDGFGPVAPGVPASFGPGVAQPPAGPQAQDPAVAHPPVPLVGLVANLPDVALAISGALFTILAFALAAWPSLPHAGPR